MDVEKGKEKKNKRDQMVFLCGILFFTSEVWKQIYCYVVVNSGHYDLWIFPFQLCSLPIYLCLFVPWMKKKVWKKTGYTFLIDFNLLGGVMAFFDTSGFRHDYPWLWIHSCGWHIAVIALGVFLIYHRMGDTSWRGFGRAVGLLFLFCGVATLFNVILHHYGETNMFYLSPFEESTQPVFREIAALWGNTVSHLIYILAMIGGGGLIHFLTRIRESVTSAGANS